MYKKLGKLNISCLFLASTILLFPHLINATETANSFIDFEEKLEYLNFIDGLNNEERDSLIQIEKERHKLITNLDEIFNYVYSIWLDKKEYKQLLNVDNVGGNEEILKLLFKSSTLDKVDFTLNDVITFLDENETKLLSFFRWDLLFYALEVDYNCKNEARVKENVTYLKSHSTLQAITEEYIKKSKNYDYLSSYAKERNLNYFDKCLSGLEAKEFVHYKTENASRTFVKGINIATDNDFFMFLENINQDRDLTGGGRLDIVTDYFSSEFLNTIWLKRAFKKDFRARILEYRTLGIGMNFFTPYIRYRDNKQLADTLFTHDRPFGSFVYVHRTEYRLWPRGRVRSKSSFQLGIIGSDWGRDIQATLHRDAIIESQKVYGWDRQIAHGGRWLLQYNLVYDFLIHSKTNKYKSLFSKAINPTPKYNGFNLIGNFNLNYGGFLTSVEGGIKISSTDFTNKSGEAMIKPWRNNSVTNFGLVIDAGISYRYVIHNSMLEGFGYLKTYRDDRYDDDAVSVYTLNQEYYEELEIQNRLGEIEDTKAYPRIDKDKDELNRYLWTFNMGFKFRFRKMVAHWDLFLLTKEFKNQPVDFESLKHLVNPVDILFYQSKTIPALESYNRRKFYGYGTIGLSWLI